MWQNHVSYNFLEGIDLTEKQIEIVNAPEEQMLIHGLAGTGKSITLLYKFVSTLMKEKEPKRVLLVTYNSNLITDIKKRLENCDEFNVNKLKHKVDIVTFHEAATEILQRNKIIERGLEYINADTKIIYQTVENLHKACPNHTGDWYFTGNYPTPGGNKVVNKAFINYIEGNNERAY